jgi:hypothetical protein
MSNAASVLKAICEKYRAQHTKESDLCAWVRDRIYEKVLANRPSKGHESITFRNALVEFIEQKALFCIYMTTPEGRILDITLPLATYIQREYGIGLTDSFSSNLNLGFGDTMDLAEQVTDDICVWVGHAAEASTT